MILHIFNPEHDIAFATNRKHFIAPHAARQLKADLNYLPALWAADTELIYVDDITSAKVHLRRFEPYANHCHFVDKKLLETIGDNITEVRPWGWDFAVKQQLLDCNIPEQVMPSNEQIDLIRENSNRQFSTRILHELIQELPYNNLIGTATHVTDPTELRLYLKCYRQAVLKAPWSNSGRGIRYIDYDHLDNNLINWAINIIQKQGGVMIEPYYNKIKDFGMEFNIVDNTVVYAGLSLFHTTNGAYTGNIIASEADKQEYLSAYFDKDFLHTLILKLENLLTKHLHPHYNGPLGIDMMIIPNPKKDLPGQAPYLLHPMVELNLRRTMGHVALALSQNNNLQNRLMKINYDGSHYHLHLINREKLKNDSFI